MSGIQSQHVQEIAFYALQVRVFSGRDHTRALGATDVWAAVGWSGDLIPLAERSADVALVAPRVRHRALGRPVDGAVRRQERLRGALFLPFAVRYPCVRQVLAGSGNCWDSLTGAALTLLLLSALGQQGVCWEGTYCQMLDSGRDASPAALGGCCR